MKKLDTELIICPTSGRPCLTGEACEVRPQCLPDKRPTIAEIEAMPSKEARVENASEQCDRSGCGHDASLHGHRGQGSCRHGDTSDLMIALGESDAHCRCKRFIRSSKDRGGERLPDAMEDFYADPANALPAIQRRTAKLLTISELEEILNSVKSQRFEMTPNGEIRAIEEMVADLLDAAVALLHRYVDTLPMAKEASLDGDTQEFLVSIKSPPHGLNPFEVDEIAARAVKP